MKKLLNVARSFRDDENGAAMVEYSILVGVIAALAILAILAIGGWVTGRFGGLCDALNGTNVPGACAKDTGVGS